MIRLLHKKPYFDAIFFGVVCLCSLADGFGTSVGRARIHRGRHELNWESMAENWKELEERCNIPCVFGFTSSVFSWDVIMSIDTHWYSTLFGWYNFKGWWIAAMVVFNLLAIHLKSRVNWNLSTQVTCTIWKVDTAIALGPICGSRNSC